MFSHEGQLDLELYFVHVLAVDQIFIKLLGCNSAIAVPRAQMLWCTPRRCL
jgi:hypothetical protein